MKIKLFILSLVTCVFFTTSFVSHNSTTYDSLGFSTNCEPDVPQINPERTKVTIFLEEGCYTDGIFYVDTSCGYVAGVILAPGFSGKYSISIPYCAGGVAVHFGGYSWSI